jgi:hypothetical protein
MPTTIRRAAYAVALLSVVLLKTNPTFEQHRKALYANSPVALTARPMPLSRMLETPKPSAADGGQASYYYGPDLTRQDYKLFSVILSDADGSRQSFGILGYVFDLRDAEYVAAEEQAAAAARFEEVAEIVEEAARPRTFGISTEIGSDEPDYSSRGCGPEQ